MCEEEQSSNPEFGPVLKEILAYVVTHPGAKDTVEGIANWWHAQSRTQPSLQEVQAALAYLVGRGWMLERGVAPARKIYWANPERLDDMRALLRQLETDRHSADETSTGSKPIDRSREG
jgi:hypothetical protein